jgi:mannose-6-phosphate isomerase-like protein (cupin superfamily)
MGSAHFFRDAALSETVAHGGRGEILTSRVVERAEGALRFVDLTVVPPGASIGLHRHGDDEEIYVIIDGEGLMTVDGVATRVGAGDVVLNDPGGSHGLENDGTVPLRLVVVDVDAH